MLEERAGLTVLGCCHLDARLTGNHEISTAAEICEHKRHFTAPTVGCKGHLAGERAVDISDHWSVCQRWQLAPRTDTQNIPLKVGYLNRCLVPLSPRSDG